MSQRHTINVTETLTALGADLADFTADVTVNLIPAGGDGWNEPREPGHAELSKVEQVDGPFIHPIKLSLWADLWVETHQDFIQRDVADARAF